MEKILRGLFLTFILTLLAFCTFGQASGSANFTFEVKFEADIPPENIELSYFPRGGNHFEKINYTADTVILNQGLDMNINQLMRVEKER